MLNTEMKTEIASILADLAILEAEWSDICNRASGVIVRLDATTTATEKIAKIKHILRDIDPLGMTQIELSIWEIVNEQKANPDDRAKAKENSQTLASEDATDVPYQGSHDPNVCTCSVCKAIRSTD